MKKDFKIFLASSILILGIVSGFIMKVLENEPVKQEKEIYKETTPLTIEIPEKRNDGTLKVLYEDGSVFYQYSGEIDILNNGRNGEEIEIVVHLPYSSDN